MLPLGKILAFSLLVERLTESQVWIPVVSPHFFQQKDASPLRGDSFRGIIDVIIHSENQLRVMRPPALGPVYTVKIPRLLPEVDFKKPKTQTFYKSSLVPSEKPVYEFRYKVHDPKEENYQEKSETRVGDSVKGYYSVKEPDGYIRLVKYVSDENGFQTQVTHHHTDDNGGGYLFAMTQHIT